MLSCYQLVVDPFGCVRLLPQTFFFVGVQARADKILNFRRNNTRGTEVLLTDTRHDFSHAIFFDGLPGNAQTLSI